MMLAHAFMEDAGTRGRSVFMCFSAGAVGTQSQLRWPMGRAAVTNPRDTAMPSGVNINVGVARLLLPARKSCLLEMTCWIEMLGAVLNSNNGVNKPPG